jgi:hypothetical protein
MFAANRDAVAVNAMSVEITPGGSAAFMKTVHMAMRILPSNRKAQQLLRFPHQPARESKRSCQPTWSGTKRRLGAGIAGRS